MGEVCLDKGNERVPSAASEHNHPAFLSGQPFAGNFIAGEAQ
jgi:hypothetical protein